jgi:eukaryotic-like serine/threonine-protein kinase
VELGADIGRILREEPISARPHTAVYQMRMFARRHRALVGGMVAIVIALGLGVVGTSMGLVRARHAEQTAVAQSKRAQRIADFLSNTIRSADPQRLPPAVARALDPAAHVWETWKVPAEGWGPAGPADVGLTGVLLHAARHLEAEFGDDPDLHAHVALLLAETLVGLEAREAAVPLTERALELLTRQRVRDEDAIIRARVLCANSHMSLGGFQTAEAQFNAALAVARTRFGPFDPRTLFIGDLLNHNLLLTPGRSQDGLAAARGAIKAAEEARGADSPEAWLRRLRLITMLQIVPSVIGRPELIAECRRTIAGLARSVGPETPSVAAASACLAAELQGDAAALPEAERLARHALEINSQAFGRDHGNTYEARTALAGILLRQGKLADAAAVARENVECSLRMIGPRSMYTLKAKGRLARILTWQERDAEEAEHLARDASERYLAYVDPVEDFASYHHAIWAAAVRQRNQPGRAESMLRERIALRGPRSPQAGSAWVESYQYLQLALCLADENRPEEAAGALRTARVWLDALQDPTSPLVLNIEEAEARLGLGSER